MLKFAYINETSLLKLWLQLIINKHHHKSGEKNEPRLNWIM